MPYLPHTQEEIDAMLAVVGVDSLEALFSTIPDSCCCRLGMQLPGPTDEWSLNRLMDGLSGSVAAAPEYKIFMGAGSYDHFIPAAAAYVRSRSEFLTGLHAVPAGDQPGYAAGHLRIPDPRRPDCMGMDVATASHVRRRHGHRRSPAHGGPKVTKRASGWPSRRAIHPNLPAPSSTTYCPPHRLSKWSTLPVGHRSRSPPICQCPSPAPERSGRPSPCSHPIFSGASRISTPVAADIDRTTDGAKLYWSAGFTEAAGLRIAGLSPGSTGGRHRLAGEGQSLGHAPRPSADRGWACLAARKALPSAASPVDWLGQTTDLRRTPWICA
jgi:hypothetical protein